MKNLTATSEQLRALIVALLAVALRELVPSLQEVDLEPVLIPIVSYMIAKAISDRSGFASLGSGTLRSSGIEPIEPAAQ